jgi:4-hydroxybutyrate dehydrogenase
VITLNAVLLPAALRFNGTAAADKYERLRPRHDLAEWVASLNATLGLPQGLAAMRVPPDVLPRIAEHAERDPSTETNARAVTRSDYEEMLRDSIGR